MHHAPALDGLRGVAILLVIFTHATVLQPSTRLEQAVLAPMILGWCGVDLFFVLSGFLITSILLHARGGRAYFRAFYARRVLRIMPLYYLLLAFVLLILPRFSHQKSAEFAAASDNSWTYWLFLSNFKNAVEGDFGHPLLAVTWSLAIEEQFYLLWPLVVLLAGSRGLRWICPALAVGSLLCRATFMYALNSDPVTLYTFTPCRLDGLALGALVAALVYDGWNPDRFAKRFALIAAAAYLAVLASEVARPLPESGRAYQYSWFACGPGFTLLSLAGCGLLLLALSPAAAPTLNRVLRASWLRSFGKYSYGIYLLHLPVRSLLRDALFGPVAGGGQPLFAFPSWGGSQLLGQAFFYPLAVAACWLTGWVSWRLIEGPILRLKRYFPYNRPLAESSPAATHAPPASTRA
ncbi:MAG: acyltransferase [Planctomycetales bacterium]|nr:acyltransferase [Planctomycetales bacterium]